MKVADGFDAQEKNSGKLGAGPTVEDGPDEPTSSSDKLLDALNNENFGILFDLIDQDGDGYLSQDERAYFKAFLENAFHFKEALLEGWEAALFDEDGWDR